MNLITIGIVCLGVLLGVVYVVKKVKEIIDKRRRKRFFRMFLASVSQPKK